MTPVRQSIGAQARRTASQRRRDGALHRSSRITGSIAVATIAAVGALGVYVAKALPGHQAGSNTVSKATVPAGNGAQGAAATSNSSTALSPPSAPPQAASAPPRVTSGST